MPKIDLVKLQQEIEKLEDRRRKRKKPAMKVSGSGVKNLRHIIIKKAKIDK